MNEIFNKMRELTKAEEQIMQVLWRQEEAFVKEIIEQLGDPKPAYSTVSTIVRILETKEFVGHKAYGPTHQYHPKVSKEEYKGKSNFVQYCNAAFSYPDRVLKSFSCRTKNDQSGWVAMRVK